MGRFDDAVLDQLATEGDPEADAVLAAHAAERPDVAPRALVAEIGRHLVLPPERGSPAITAYLQQRPPLPGWADPALLRAGAGLFAEQGLEICTALLCASLPESYAGARGARVLCLTTRLVERPRAAGDGDRPAAVRRQRARRDGARRRRLRRGATGAAHARRGAVPRRARSGVRRRRAWLGHPAARDRSTRKTCSACS